MLNRENLFFIVQSELSCIRNAILLYFWRSATYEKPSVAVKCVRARFDEFLLSRAVSVSVTVRNNKCSRPYGGQGAALSALSRRGWITTLVSTRKLTFTFPLPLSDPTTFTAPLITKAFCVGKHYLYGLSRLLNTIIVCEENICASCENMKVKYARKILGTRGTRRNALFPYIYIII